MNQPALDGPMCERTARELNANVKLLNASIDHLDRVLLELLLHDDSSSLGNSATAAIARFGALIGVNCLCFIVVSLRQVTVQPPSRRAVRP